MDMLKKFFPFAFTAKADVAALVISVLIQLVIGVVVGFVIGIVALIGGSLLLVKKKRRK